MIIGLPSDTKDLADYTHKTLMDLKVPLITPNHCAYLPGTELLNQTYEKKDKYLTEIFDSRWKFNNAFDIVAGTNTLSKEELGKCSDDFYAKYYSYDRMLETACQYYGKFKFFNSPRHWADGDANNYLKVVVHNVFSHNAAMNDQHYLSGGSYSVDLKLVARLLRDAAIRKEKGFNGVIYKFCLSFLSLLLPIYLKIAMPKQIRERNIQK